MRYEPIHRDACKTTSEEILTELCDSCFFSLWSYPNLFTDKGKNNESSDGKELCDLLIIFDKDILVFSDKKIEFKDNGDFDTNYKRWYKKAVKKSIAQVTGAERWIKAHPDRIYTDKDCKQKLPLDISKDVEFHKIIVISNISDSVLKFLNDSIIGTFGICNFIYCDEQHYDHPFVFGFIDENKTFVHIFNEVSINILLKELDTAYDFIP